MEYSILKSSGEELTLEHLGRDDDFGLREGDWVEIIDDGITLRGDMNPFLQVKSIDRDRMVAGLDVPDDVDLPVYDETSTSHPMLRRWDHKKMDPTLGYPNMADDGTLQVEEGKWLLLEDGIQIYFESASEDNPHLYRTGDNWSFAVRADIGVLWLGLKDDPESKPPLGIYHSYAPLAVLTDNQGVNMTDCRREINLPWTSPPGRTT